MGSVNRTATNLDSSTAHAEDEPERKACLAISPSGFHLRPPPAPHLLSSYLTPDTSLFQTIHMGAAVVSPYLYTLKITGLVLQPFTLALPSLLALPSTTTTSFHECYGSPLTPPTKNIWRVGNVEWTGVPLRLLLEKANPTAEAKFVWCDGLDCGSFGGVESDRYRKDLPLSKAVSSEVLVAYAMNGAPLNKERGGPVRLVVPGWFGTNSVKWLCRIEVADKRAGGVFTTTFYNEVDPDGDGERTRPVWGAEVNSMVTKPAPGEVVRGKEAQVTGWAWSGDGVARVRVSVDGGAIWAEALLDERKEFGWQGWKTNLKLESGTYSLMARAESTGGAQQPLSGRRNHVHNVEFMVVGD